MTVEHPNQGAATPHLPDMLSVEEALQRILALVECKGSKKVPLLEAQGQVLAENVYSPLNIPMLPNSAMDGYAVLHSDLVSASLNKPVELRVVGQIRAGELPQKSVSTGLAIRIMTGAPLPDGADAVVPYEFTDESDRLNSGRSLSSVAIRRLVQAGDNIRPSGEDLKIDSLALSEGHLMDAPTIGLLASMGFSSVKVIQRPLVAILATGDEVREPGEELSPGCLYDSNSYCIAAAVRQYGGIPLMLGIAKDNIEELHQKISEALHADMLITSAGVSGGAFDMVKDVLHELGSISFWSVRMRPSKPLAFGLLNSPKGSQVPHLGLPGNPVSALVALVQFVRPALMKMMGKRIEPLPQIQAILRDHIINSDGRRVFARVNVEYSDGSYYAALTGAQGSNLLTSMVHAQGLAICPETSREKSPGDTVSVEMLDWATLPVETNIRRSNDN